MTLYRLFLAAAAVVLLAGCATISPKDISYIGGKPFDEMGAVTPDDVRYANAVRDGLGDAVTVTGITMDVAPASGFTEVRVSGIKNTAQMAEVKQQIQDYYAADLGLMPIKLICYLPPEE